MSGAEQKSAPIIGTAERMKAEKKYGDALLYSWGLIEQEIDTMLGQLGHGKNNIDNMSFGCKVKALSEAGYFSQDDVREVSHFQQKRVAVFHRYTSTMMWASDDKPKEELADIAISALKACTNAFTRNMRPIRQTDSIREYFLSYETVEPNEFRVTTKCGTAN